jgi:phosphatidate phosphatase APP1
VIVVPLAMLMKVNNFLTATGAAEVDNSAGATTVRTFFNNPVTNNPIAVTYTLLSNQFVRAVTSSDTTWYIGDFPEMFVLNNGWDQEQMEQGQESNAYFESNILYRQRFSYNQKGYAYAPFRGLKCT